MNSLNDGLQPILFDAKVLDKLSHQQYAWRFLLPFGIVLFIVLQSTIILATNGFDLTDSLFFPNVITKFMPQNYIAQGRFYIPLAVLAEFFVFSHMLVDKMNHSNYLMLPKNGNQLWYPLLRKSMFFLVYFTYVYILSYFYRYFSNFEHKII